MPRPLASDYPKEHRWRFIQRSIPGDQLVSFANTIVDSNNKELHQELPKILDFIDPGNNDLDSLNHEWLSIWVNIMHQGGLGYTVTRADETRLMATDLSQYLADTQNVIAYYYYWALRFQYPWAFPKHSHYINHNISVQPVILVGQYLDILEKKTGDIDEVYLSGYEIAQFLMKSANNRLPLINSNCTEIIENRQRGYNYNIECQNPGFVEAASHLFSRGRLFIDNFNLLTFDDNRILINDDNTLEKLRAFISYRKSPFIFKTNSQDVRNEFFIEAYSDLDPDPEILYDSVDRIIVNPVSVRTRRQTYRTPSAPLQIINPPDTRGTFGTGTRAERKFQAQLRRDLISMYGGRCCVCGLDKPEFLIASHIVAVNVDPSVAADRQNCLLLCVLHDRAMEKGYFGLRDNYSIIVNQEKSLRHPILRNEIARREGQLITLPDDRRLHPLVNYIKRHRIAHGIIQPEETP